MICQIWNVIVSTYFENIMLYIVGLTYDKKSTNPTTITIATKLLQ
jgi:hypothetical protein